MDTIIVNPKNEKELKLVNEFLEKLGVSNKVLSDEEKESFGIFKGSFESQDTNEYKIPEAYYEVLNERRARHLAGESASYSWQEMKEAAKKNPNKKP